MEAKHLPAAHPADDGMELVWEEDDPTDDMEMVWEEPPVAPAAADEVPEEVRELTRQLREVGGDAERAAHAVSPDPYAQAEALGREVRNAELKRRMFRKGLLDSRDTLATIITEISPGYMSYLETEMKRLQALSPEAREAALETSYSYGDLKAMVSVLRSRQEFGVDFKRAIADEVIRRRSEKSSGDAVA